MQRLREMVRSPRLSLGNLTLGGESLALYVFAIVVGVGAAGGAIAFRELLTAFDWLFFDILADEGFDLLGDWRVLLIPAIGGLFVGPVIYLFAREAKGHGVPEVMLAVETQGGRIRPRVAVVKAFASSLTIASGGSVGREGPIVQIASAVGSTVGQFARLSDDDVRLLVAAGAAGGISATFNAPIAGVFFALEVILRRFNARNFSVVVLSSVVASAVAHARFGDERAFIIPEYRLESALEFPLYAALGLIAAGAAIAFIRVLYGTEDLFDRVPMPEWVKPAFGGLGVGLLGVAFIGLLGVGYGSGPSEFAIPGALSGDHSLRLLIALGGLKILATSITVGSGGSGGVFAPSLFIGAMVGGAFGVMVDNAWPGVTAPPGAYALVGMGAVFAGASRAPITAILILFEMTRDYSIILPLMTSVVISAVVAQLIMRESIYTLKLRRRGIDITERREPSPLASLTIGSAMRTDFEVVRADTPVEQLVRIFSSSVGQEGALPVVDEQRRLVGILSPSDLDKLMEGERRISVAAEVATKNPITAYPNETLDTAVRRMADRGLRQMPVVSRADPGVLMGMLRRSDVFAAYSKIGATPVRPPAYTPLAGLEAYGTEIAEVRLERDAPPVGLPLKDVHLPAESIVVSIIRNGRVVIPRGDVTLEAGDRLAVAMVPRVKQDVLRRLSGSAA